MFERSTILVGAATILIATVSLPATGWSTDGPYLSLLVAGAETDDVEADDIEVEYDTSPVFAGQFGYQFNTFRLGGELGVQLAEGESGNDVNSDVDITRFTLNGYVDLPLAVNFVPYIGGGFGVANLKADDDFEDEDSAFTWHGELGLAIGVTDHFSLAPVYRYQWIDSDIGGQTEPLESHIFGVSLRYQFYGAHRADAYSGGGRYDSGYSSYGASHGYYDRYDRHDRHYHDRHRHKRPKTPEQLERDRCGWKGPGCES